MMMKRTQLDWMSVRVVSMNNLKISPQTEGQQGLDKNLDLSSIMMNGATIINLKATKESKSVQKTNRQLNLDTKPSTLRKVLNLCPKMTRRIRTITTNLQRQSK